MDRKKYFSVIFIIIILVGCNSPTSASTPSPYSNNNECAAPAVKLAYPIAYDEEGIPTPQSMPQHLPSTPYWEPYFSIKDELKNSMGEGLTGAVISTSHKNKQGIDTAWIFYATTQSENPFRISSLMQIDLTKGEILSQFTDSSDANAFPTRLFSFENGDLWGTRFQVEDNASILFHYNEKTKQFEAIVDQDSLLTGKFPFPNIVPDDYRNVLWISRYESSVLKVYKFDPSTYKLEEDKILSSLGSRSFVIDPKGLIWVLYKTQDGDKVASYNPDASELKEYWERSLKFNSRLKIPLFFDSKERLWFGDSAWLDTSQSPPLWYELIPSPYFIVPNPVPFVPYGVSGPYSIFESLDGYFWFEGPQGLVRLDTLNGEWCLMTTEYGGIIEDSRKNLWLLADGVLYKHTMTP